MLNRDRPTATPRRRVVHPRGLGSDGVALPLALLGLLIVSFLVVSAIVTSGSELTGSSTHRSAAASLYGADGAVEAYVAAKAADGTNHLTAVSGDPALPGYTIDVARLKSYVENNSGDLHQEELYSVIATPALGRGRIVGAFIETIRDVKAFTLDVQAGLTVGGDAKIAGNATISDGSNNLDNCAEAPAEHAIQVSDSSTITKQGNATIVGTADTASYTQAQMVDQLLGGLTIPEAVALATHRLKRSTFTKAPSSTESGVPRQHSNAFNWGCPEGNGCRTVADNGHNFEYFPMIAVDAEGGKVKISGDHGQGVLIVHNGSAEFDGNMVYHGIIIVEKDLMVRGTVRIQGAVVALGENSTLEDDLTGTATVTYNRCINTRAQEAANQHRLANAPQDFPGRTFNWFEQFR